MDEDLKRRISNMPDGRWILAQLHADVKTMSVEQFVTDRLDKGLVGWNHPSFAKIAAKQKERDDYVLKPYEVEEGVITCAKCGSKKVFSTVIQTRASDEPMTTVAHCVNCKTKWTQNG